MLELFGSFVFTIPARIMRTVLKIPILAVSLELYDDKTNTMREKVKKVQWLDEDTGDLKIRGKRVLIVDEVDDTRTTLMYCVEELLQSQNAPAAIAVAVVHNKLKKKHGKLPDNIDYFSGEDVEDIWNCYPWEAGEYGLAITEHEALARKCAGVRDDSSLGLPQINLLASFFAGAALYALFFTRK